MKVFYIWLVLTFNCLVFAQTLFERQIVPFDAMGNDFFGQSIATNDSLLFISSLRYQNTIESCVYVYKFENNDYTYLTKIFPDDPEANALFGTNILYADEQLFVGTQNKKINGYTVGALYIFTYENGGWVQKQRIIPPEPLSSQKYFSNVVAKLNETLVVSAFRSDAGAIDNGKVFIFNYKNGQYILSQEIFPFDPKDYQFFGTSLVIKNNLLLIGCQNDSTASGWESGSVYAYNLIDTLWTFTRKYLPNIGSESLTLGASMVSNDKHVFVGTSGSIYFNKPGQVYIYKINDNLIDLQQIISSDEGYFDDKFGIVLDVKGDTLLVSALFDTVANYSSGSVYLFQEENEQWIRKIKIRPSDPSLASWFGNSLKISENIFFIGSKLAKVNNEYPGKVYLFSSSPLSVLFDPILLGPSIFKLSDNYPNPFNPSTKISYNLPQSGNVLLKVYDILGNEVATLINEHKEPGNYSIEFNASGLSSGIYFYQLVAENFISTKKMILLQ